MGAVAMKNIVFITVDSLRADYVTGPKAPDSLETLPQLIEEWLTCSTAYANAPYTKQSFLSILSGSYPWTFESAETGFDPDRVHIAERLSEEGYATGGFHSNTYLSPTYNYDRGFDYYLGRDSGGDGDTESELTSLFNTAVERAVATEQLSDLVLWTYQNAGKRLGIQLGSNLYKPAEELNQHIVNWTQQQSEPVFVWAHYMDVHNPYYPHEGTVSEGISRRRAVKLFHKVNQQRSEAAESDINALERLYRGEIEYFDRQLGNLLERLDETIGLEETLLVFTSDHGEAFNEKGLVFHPGSALYEENVHVPMLIDGPEISGGEIETPVSHVDLVPTILKRAGIEAPESVDGRDIAGPGFDATSDRIVFTESYDHDDGGLMGTDGEYKLIRDLETGKEIFCRRHSEPEEITQPDESESVAYDRLAGALDDHMKSVTSAEVMTTDGEISENVRLQLRKLGYKE
ncbi:sulfatase [Haloarcula rubripromontorii]|nr:sulfatase [Haloarcula rubripromontorii]